MTSSPLKTKRQQSWEDQLHETSIYVKTHGAIPQKGHRLRDWLNRQRNERREGRLPDHKRTQLDEKIPGWPGFRLDENWMNRIDGIARTYPVGQVPKSAGRDYSWLAFQRRQHSLGRLSTDKVRMLDSKLPLWKDGCTGKTLPWADSLLSVLDVFTSTGKLPCRDSKAGRWLSEQRRHARSGKLGSQRQRELDEKLPGWEFTQHSLWAVRLSELAGTPEVETLPTSHQLRKWLQKQRWHLKNGSITTERQRLLDAAYSNWRSM
ncbi:helicase associated domain-containing protein [Lysinibacter cavernae]|uniref:helicase associated domain-containing protein n=1 Tax=Lysinibacter cavernae TaxID=1640652 RepID=UPI003611B6DB